MNKKKRIVITGMGVVSCFGNDVEHFYNQLLAGKSGVQLINHFSCEDFPTKFAASILNFDPAEGDYLEKKQARRVDPFIAYTVIAGRKALDHAGLTADKLDSIDKSRAGIIIGSGMGGMKTFAEGVTSLNSKSRLTPFFVPFIIGNMGGALLGINTGFKGPNYSISTACATSNNCIVAAAEHIQSGRCDLMVCGGSEATILPIGIAGFVACKALSEMNEHPTKASRPWDIHRDGFVMGEGSGVLVLESLDHALARGAPIYGEYLGGYINCDAYHMTNPLETGERVAACMEGAIKNAGIDLEQINYINAHATSTPVGDMCEINGIHYVFKGHTSNIKINATKSMIGHCLGAAGGIEAIATLKAIETGWLHPTINLDNPEPNLRDLQVVGSKAEKHVITAALSNSFGFGGHNSSIILAPYQV